MEIKQRYGPGSNYYARFMVRNRRIVWCTRTPDKQLARARAKEYREKIVAKEYHLVDLMKSANGMPTIKQVTDEYLALPVGGALSSRNANIAALRLVMKAGGVGNDDGIYRIDGSLALGWQTHCLGSRQDGSNRSHSVLVTCNSRLRKAKAVFSRRAMQFYAVKFKMPLEQIKGFLAVPFLAQGEAQRAVPSDEAMAKAEALLFDGTHNAELCAYLLAKYGGLRPIEIINAKWSWIKEGAVYVGGTEGAATTKNKRFRIVSLDPAVIAVLESAKTHDSAVAGARAEYTVRRVLPGLLLNCGFPSPDPIVSLRRWNASWRYENQSPSAARDALGHSTESVTMRHYARRLSLPAAVPFRAAAAPAAGSQSPQCDSRNDS